MELLCPAGSFPALKAAIDNGADAVYVGLNNDTNARHFAGLNFSPTLLRKAVDYVKSRQKKLHVAINTFVHPGSQQRWYDTIDTCAELGVDAIIIADPAALNHAYRNHPDLERHLSVQASATNEKAIAFYQQQFSVSRVVLPRVLSVHQIQQLSKTTSAELEVFAFGSLCIMAEGRCYLSSYFCGESPNTSGACSPAKYVRWENREQGLESRLNEILIDRFPDNQSAGYPTLCKGRYQVDDQLYHAIEEPSSLNTLPLLPKLKKMGITALKIEGRQRSQSYIATVTRIWRDAIDQCLGDPESFQVHPEWVHQLNHVSEGIQTTLGAYHRGWQ